MQAYFLSRLWRVFFVVMLLVDALSADGQQVTPADSSRLRNERLDSLMIAETEKVSGKEKILHAEPLFIDLIRDLGARKGEREWNIGFGMTDRKTFDSYNALIEYEFAPADRLGLELELPFSFYYRTDTGVSRSEIPRSRLNSLKLAAQYTFLVDPKFKTSWALGYIHEFEFISFDRYGKAPLLKGHLFNPFVIGAKRWGDQFHTLVYAGPQVQSLERGAIRQTTWQVNTNVHYMISGTRNFIGLELNKELRRKDFDMIIRPQMRIGLADNFLVGIVTGIPVRRETQRFSSFIRLIYEPRHRA